MARIWGFDGTEKLTLFKVVIADDRVDYIFVEDLGNTNDFPFLGLYAYLEEKQREYEGNWDDKWYANVFYEFDFFKAKRNDGSTKWFVNTGEEGDMDELMQWCRSLHIDPDGIKPAGRYKIADPMRLMLHEQDPPGTFGHGNDMDFSMNCYVLLEMQDSEEDLYVLLRNERVRDGEYSQWYHHPILKKPVPLFITLADGRTLPRSSVAPPKE